MPCCAVRGGHSGGKCRVAGPARRHCRSDGADLETLLRLLSDRWRNRKHLALLGYGMAAVVKPLFPLASSVTAVFVGALRRPHRQGHQGCATRCDGGRHRARRHERAAFGLRQSLDTIGAVAGPLIAIGLMAVLMMDLRLVMWVACVPALIAVAVLAFGVQEPVRREEGGQKPGFDLRTASALGSGVWMVTAVGAAMMMARFSEAFLVLKAADTGLRPRGFPWCWFVMSAVYSLSSYPAGVLSDRFGRGGCWWRGSSCWWRRMPYSHSEPSIASVLAGVALWGLHMGLTQGGLSAMVADAAPKELRGTAFGVFNLASGVALLVGSVLAGVLGRLRTAGHLPLRRRLRAADARRLAWVKPRQPEHAQA